MDEAPSDKLHSHIFERKAVVDREAIFVCKTCKFKAFGSQKGPTVWTTRIIHNKEILSCNEMIVKDILE